MTISPDPSDRPESDAELARDVLDAEELADYLEARAGRAHVQAVRDRNRRRLTDLSPLDGAW